MIKQDYTDIMIDVETLGNEGKFVVTQVSLVPFFINPNIDAGSGLTSCFDMGISVKDSLKKGFELDVDTIKWWINTNTELLGEQLNYSRTVEEVCEKIVKYISTFDRDVRFWATATLDYQAISNIFNSVNIKNPIKYNKRFCARTVRLLAGEDKDYKNNNSHNATEDCVNQIIQLRTHLDILKIKLD